MDCNNCGSSVDTKKAKVSEYHEDMGRTEISVECENCGATYWVMIDDDDWIQEDNDEEE